MQDVCLDRGVSSWRFLQANETENTTASTAYVDLKEYVFNIITGTVRIESEDRTLEPASLEYIYSTDPNRDEENVPEHYALDSSSDPEIIRLALKPIPDGVYTISFVAETIIEEDGISSFPAWMHGAIIDLATSIALRRLGLGEPDFYEQKYNKRKQNAKESQGLDCPQYVNRVNFEPPDIPLQSRTP